MKTLRLFFLSLTTIITCNLFAVSIWSGSSDIFTSGAGTAASPYLIQSADQLAFIAEMVNGGVTHYQNEYFKLITDIDLNNITWTPIGDSKTNYFAGNFDGNNHKISNLRVNQSTFAGLFGYVKSESLKNITISSGVCSSLYGPAAGIVAKIVSACYITNCVNKANISCTNSIAGGIVGEADTISILKSVNYGQINGGAKSGGIIGSCCVCEISQNVNYGIVSSTNSSQYSEGTSVETESIYGGTIKNYTISVLYKSIAGGIVGFSSKSGSKIEFCYNFGQIKGVIASATYSCPSHNDYSLNLYYHYNYVIIKCNVIGGIAGELGGLDTIQYCSNRGGYSSDFEEINVTNYTLNKSNPLTINALTQNDPITRAGGIIGEAKQTTINFSRNSGNMPYGMSGYSNFKRGNYSTITYPIINYCYNTANEASLSNACVKANNSYNAALFSQIGIADSVTNNTITNCYYISGTGRGTQKTDIQMKSASMPIILNADSTVFIRDITPNVNNGYPIFNRGHIYTKTNPTTNVSFTSATLNGNYYGCTPDSMGFEVQDISDNSIIRYTANNAQPCSMQLGNLDQGTTYSAKYWLAYDGFTYYGDTVMFTTLACPTHPVQSDTVSICEGETYEFAGRTLSASGVYRDSLVAITGCDSVVELVLRIYDTYRYIRYDTIMQGESYDFYGNQLTETGVYNEYIRTTNRCNWVQLNLYVIESQGTGIDNVAEEQKPVKIMEDGHLYILLPDGTRYDATGKKVE